MHGLVLKRHNLGEADRILTIFSGELGKLRVVAKGVRRGRSKLAGHLEPFVETELHLARGRNLDVVTGARGQRYYLINQDSLETITTAYLCLEIIDRLMADEQVSEPVYALVGEVLAGLEGGINYLLARHYFFVKFLYLTGQQPNMETTDEIQEYFLNFDAGVISGQVQEGQEARPIAKEIIKLWRLIYGNDLAQISRLGGVGQHLAAAQELIELFYDYHLHTRFRSEKILG